VVNGIEQKLYSMLIILSPFRKHAARVVGKTAQASDAVRRVSEFLKRDTRPPFQDSDDDDIADNDTVINLANNSFSINPETPLLFQEEKDRTPGRISISDDHEEASHDIKSSFTVQTTQLQVHRSEIVAVIGRVGSGKTMLLRALLGELQAQDRSTVALRGKIAYASQQPFILNASFRNNVLFGSDFDEERYEKSLDACCLRQDIQRLGPAGDLTEIGERGVTLSGGMFTILRLCCMWPD